MQNRRRTKETSAPIKMPVPLGCIPIESKRIVSPIEIYIHEFAYHLARTMTRDLYEKSSKAQRAIFVNIDLFKKYIDLIPDIMLNLPMTDRHRECWRGCRQIISNAKAYTPEQLETIGCDTNSLLSSMGACKKLSNKSGATNRIVCAFLLITMSTDPYNICSTIVDASHDANQLTTP